MSVLYLTEQNSILRKRGERLVVEKDGQLLLDLPEFKLDAVCIFGNVQFTTQAATLLLDKGIELALFSIHGRLKGQLTPPHPANVPLRIKQYNLSQDEAFCLQISKCIVEAKVSNSLSLMLGYAKNHPERDFSTEHKSMQRHLDSVRQCLDLEILRGLEGIVARDYFAAYARMVDSSWDFHQRIRRPPPDAVNALLSFGYVLIGNELHALLDGLGFDPYIGFYHGIRYGRASLALDLLEEFRAPVVDRLVVRLLNLRILTDADFAPQTGGGLYLTAEGIKKYFAQYEKWLSEPAKLETPSFRKVFRQQAEALLHAVRDGAPYTGFRW